MPRKEQEKKTLLSVLNGFDDDQIVAIGGDGGNAFVYIGRAGDRQLIDIAFNDYLIKMQTRLAETEAELKRLLLRNLKLTGDENGDRFIIRGAAQDIRSTYNTMLICESYIRKYEKPFGRVVKKVHKKEVDDAFAIIVDGSELGDFWFKKEFDEKYGK